MSRIPPLTTLRVEDFPPEQRKWLPRLFVTLNQFLTNVTNAINGRIEFVKNIPALDIQLDFTYDGLAQRFRWPLTSNPAILWVGRATEAGIASTVFAEWEYDASTQAISVTFSKVAGTALTIGTRYRIFVRVVP